MLTMDGSDPAVLPLLRVTVEEDPGREIEPVVARRGDLARLDVAELAEELRVVLADVIGDLPLEPAGHTGEDVDEAVQVGGDEVDRRAVEAHLVHRGADRLPPAMSAA